MTPPHESQIGDPHDEAPETNWSALNAASRELNPSGRGANAPGAQVGGQHYGGKALQHWDIVAMFNLDYFQGNITKYVMRYDKKDGIKDLEKARHYLDKYIEVLKQRQGS